MNYKEILKFYPDFPVAGVNFVDIIPFIQDKDVFKSLVMDLSALCDSPNIAAPEARGFLFAAPMLVLADHVKNVVPIRKKGKLPYAEGDLVGVDIVKEYGRDSLFFRLSDIAAGEPGEDGTIGLTLFDDVLATGGTARGLAKKLEECSVSIKGKTYRVRVTDFVFLVEIDELGGAAKLTDIAPVKSLIHL